MIARLAAPTSTRKRTSPTLTYGVGTVTPLTGSFVKGVIKVGDRLPRLTSVLLVVTFATLLQSVEGVAHADRIDDLSKTLESDRSEKARIAAAVGLGNIADPRGVPALIHALADSSVLVRRLAAYALGRLGDARAVAPLEHALSDDDDQVRQRAREALDKLRPEPPSPGDEPSGQQTVIPKESPREKGAPPKLYVNVKAMVNKGSDAKELGGKLHDYVADMVANTPEMTVDAGEGASLTQFVVDGAITKISRQNDGPYVNITCEVKLTVSTADGKILSFVNGDATVQMTKSSWTPGIDSSVQLEALENAVLGIRQNLKGFLVKQLAQK